MSNKFSTYKSKLWSMFKNNNMPRNRTELKYGQKMEHILQFSAESMLKKGAPAEDVLADALHNMTDWHAVVCWRWRRINHYFLAPGLVDFFFSTIKSADPNYLLILPKVDEVKGPLCGDDPSGKDKITSCFALHFPLNEVDRSVIVFPEKNYKPVFEPTYPFFATDGQSFAFCPDECEPRPFKDDGPATRLIKIVLGFSLYIDAFPDTVVPSRDGRNHHIKFSKTNVYEVKANEVVTTEDKRSLSPHWRRGHFRVFKSDRFIHKKGATIYIAGTFVKGSALDVLELGIN